MEADKQKIVVSSESAVDKITKSEFSSSAPFPSGSDFVVLPSIDFDAAGRFPFDDGVVVGSGIGSMSHTIPQSMTFFLVDVENVGSYWIDYLLLGNFSPLKVLLFFSEPGPRLSYFDLCRIEKGRFDFSCFLCEKGENALDFQLSTYLGFLLASARSGERFIILSNDHGYDVACRFWRKQGYFVDRVGINLAAKAAYSKPEVKGKREDLPRSYVPHTAEQNSTVSGVLGQKGVALKGNTSPSKASVVGLSDGHASQSVLSISIPDVSGAESSVKPQPDILKVEAETQNVAGESQKLAGDVGLSSKQEDVRKQCVEMIRNVLPQQKKIQAEGIFKLLSSKRNDGLQIIYQTFVKVYGQKIGLDLYHYVKPLVGKIQGVLR